MTFCPRCGGVLALGARKCGDCGRPIGGVGSEREGAAESRLRSWMKVLLGLLVGLLILTLLLRLL